MAEVVPPCVIVIVVVVVVVVVLTDGDTFPLNYALLLLPWRGTALLPVDPRPNTVVAVRNVNIRWRRGEQHTPTQRSLARRGGLALLFHLEKLGGGGERRRTRRKEKEE